MRHPRTLHAALACALAVLFTDGAWATEWPDECTESTLPSDDPNHPSPQLILTCLPSDFNGTLIVYAHGYVRPQEPLSLPEEFGNADVQELVQQLVNLGFGVATSSFHKNGYAIQQAEADLNRLVDYVRSIEPDLETVYSIGASEGGLITAMLIEQHPDIYDGGLALCGPLAGTNFQIKHLADVRVLFDYFYRQVFPFGVLDVPANAHEQWDGPEGFKAKIAAAIEDDPGGIAQVFDVAQVTCKAGDPAVAANCAENMLRTACSARTTCWRPPAAGR
jgi:pimeloyl-ACP methyl ester carboxylesterase